MSEDKELPAVGNVGHRGSIAAKRAAIIVLSVGAISSVIERDAAGFGSLRRQIQVRRWIRDNVANTVYLSVARITAAQA